MSESTPNTLYSVLAFIGFLLACFPLPRHIQCASWNVGICMCMLWVGLGCLMFFVNSILWSDNVVNRAPVWGDISARFLVGASVGIPASSLSITRRLYYITHLQAITVEKDKRRREIIVDICIGIGLPCVVMALQYVVQRCRFLLFEQFGCYPCNVNAPASYILVYMWQPIINLISFTYAVLTLRMAFLQHMRLRNALLTGYQIEAGYHWRLMALCCLEIVYGLPLSFYIIIVNTMISPIVPYVSWANVHSTISEVHQHPAVEWQSEPIIAVSLQLLRWLYPFRAFIVFALFGLAPEARQVYLEGFWFLFRRLGVSRPTSPSPSSTAVSKRKRHLPYAGQLTFSIDEQDMEQRIRTKQLSIPGRARTKACALRSSLSFATSPYGESWTASFTSQLSGDEESAENPSGVLTPLASSVAHHSHSSRGGTPATLQSALGGGSGT